MSNYTLCRGRGNRYGFKAGSFKPGYFPSPAQGRGYKVENPDEELSRALATFSLRLSELPDAAKAAWMESKGFTLVVGVAARSLSRECIPARQWINHLRGHQQMVRSLQRTHVYILYNSNLQLSARPLQLAEIRPIPGADTPRTMPIPTDLLDPNTNDLVPTGAIPNLSRLTLRTSDVSMRFKLKARHTINGWTHDNRSTGYWEVPTLSRAAYAEKIYGDVYLQSLVEFRQNDRKNHSDAPLTRALRQWLSEELEAYSAEFVKLDKLQASNEERDALRDLNDKLNSWKNQFLEKEFGGIGEGAAAGSGGDPRNNLKRGNVSRIVLRVSHEYSGQGVTFRPSLNFLDASGNRVRSIPYNLESSDWAVAKVDEDLNMITTFSPGLVSLTAVCKDTGIRSKPVEIEVLDIIGVDLNPLEMEIHAGSRKAIVATVTTRDGRQIVGAYLIWTEDNAAIVSVGASGLIFGLTPGQSDVVAGDNQTLAAQPTRIRVLEPKDKTREGGSGFPRILLSEIDDDPLGESPPVFSDAEPPVHQRTQDVDHNVWWINMASPLARRYIDTARGAGAQSREWRVYMLERYIEVMVKILLTYDLVHGNELTFESMLHRWDKESTAMHHRASQYLQSFLDGGEVGVSM